MSQSQGFLSPELTRIFNELEKKTTEEQKIQAAIELRNVFPRFIMHSEEIFLRLLKMMNNSSNDANIKMSGLIGVDQLTFVIQENQYIGFVNKFIQVVFQQFKHNQDEKILRKTAKVYEKLLRIGGTKIVTIIESNVSQTISWLKDEQNKEIKKFAAILALQELLKEAPFITFNILFNSPSQQFENQRNNQFMLVWNLIKNRKQNLREEALNFFNECIKQISQREIHLQKEWLNKFYEEIKRTQNSKEDETIHGNIYAINILLTHADVDIFMPHINEIIQMVLNKRGSQNFLIQKAVIITIPTLAKYAKQIFVSKYLQICIDYLLESSKTVEKKEISYQTLSDLFMTLDEVNMNKEADRVVKRIQDVLLEFKSKKFFCIQCMTCLKSITRKFQHKITDFTDINTLIDQVLLNGLYPQSIELLKYISRYLGRTVSQYIQAKLLLAISVILTNTYYCFNHPQELDIMNIHGFQMQLNEAVRNADFKSDESIAMAIQTLSSFSFDHYQDYLAKFVKDCVLQYLDNRKPNIRKAAAQAGCLLCVNKGKAHAISTSIMYEILEKFLNVAISDTEDEIRQEMLSSLNGNFDFYMNSPNYLRKLFLCVNDTNPKVQELALRILCRLAGLNPSDIVPFMKKILFQYLSQLTLYEMQNEGQVIDLINLLTCFIKHGSHIVKPHAESIASILIQHLKDPTVSGHLIPSLLKCFSQLTALGEPQVMVYLHEIIPIILQAVQDKSYTVKREAAVKSLVEICKNVGYVIMPYYRYPQIMGIILGLLKNETSKEIRYECLRMIGCMGTIDYFYYKKVVQKLSSRYSTQEEKNANINNVINSTLKLRLKSSDKYMKAKKNEGKNNLVKELHKYYEDLILLGNFNEKKKMFLHLANLEAKYGYSVPQYNKPLYNNKIQYGQQDFQLGFSQQALPFMIDNQDINVQELLTNPTVIQLNNNDYYSEVTIKAVLKILCDNSLRAHHDLAIETLQWILGNLKSRTSHFLNLIIPVFKKIIKQVDLKEKLLKLIERIINHCGVYFQVDWIDSIIQIFLDNAQEQKTTNICFDIMVTLIKYCKNHLRHKIELLIREVNLLIMKNEDDRDLIKKALTIYRNLGDLLDSYLHIIIPFLCKLITREHDQRDYDIRREIIELLKYLAINCSSTIQNLSLIVKSLIQVMHLVYNSNEPETMQAVVSCFVIFILKYKNSFLVYLPLVNDAINKYKVYNNRYKECILILLNYGNLYDIHNLLQRDETGKEKDELTEFIKLSKKTQDEAYTIDQQQGQNKESHMFKKNIDAISLIKEFDTQQKTLKEDWKEWMRKSSVELLRQSSNLVLAPCYSIAEVYPELSTELYNIAFACVWGILNDQQKEFIIQQLHKVINPQTNENIPIEILQTILNLAEFMQHDKEGLQIDNSTLGDLAERCEAYAKALYYREHEFETASEKTIESLISLYTNLGQKEAASGLLTYAKKNLKIDLKMSWYERLQNWEKALDDYRIEQLKDPQNDNFIPRMRCLNALSNWENLLNQCEPYILNNAEIPEEKLGQQKEIVHLAANAAMNLGSWDKLEKCVKQLPNENTDKEFWQAAVCINQKKYFEAREYIKRSITKLDSKVSGLLLESYNRAYDNLLRLQQLFEMEEIIDLLLFKEKVKYIIQDQRGESKTNMIEEYDRRKSNLQDIWNDRLNGNPRDTDTWQKVLSVRGLLFSKAESMETWLKFARMALKQDQNQISQKIIDKLKEEINPRAINEFDYPPKLVVSNFQVQLKNGIIKEKQFNEQLTLFLLDKSKNIDNSLKSKIFLKMGKQMYQKQDELNPEYIYQVNKLYKKSFEFDEGFHKTWHQSALLNYDAVKFYENNPNTIKQVEFENFIYSSLKGFIKSIALGNQSEKRSKYMLQDSLRLLQIIFQYSHLENVAKEFNDNFETIDIRTWIEVVPQIIARIANQKLLHKLLLHISKHSPQALIYPLTVACKDKQTGRAVSAQQILDDMKTHSPNLVQQALLIAEELNRTAILMKEKWYEGIENAWKDHHSAENNSKAFINQLMELHGLMKLKPESQSEIAFHQNHGTDLAEAEAWLQKYQQTENEICLCQAFDIYYNTYTKISTKLENLTCVHLENVSPKLLATKNCEISIPGLYKPNKPIVKIACFQPKLPVLSSKQHPRRLFIYGTDNKQYGFLLKGREDLRQDERVMQLFALVNRLLHNNPKTEKKDLLITRYSVTPLSTQTGLLGWVSDCDTLQCLIREYRKTYNIRGTTENDLKSIFCNNYDLLPLPNKVEIFRHILENTKGEDLQKVLWLKSNTSETWLERRTNYTRSLATMSIVGYILGLGDRHPSNIMLQRYTGKIVHIDFGDCFEVAMKRDKFPEKVPFRLTRMLVNAMEACGIEGNYRSICEAVMQVCTDNKESLLAVLEAFVYDPIITWKLLTMEDAESKIGGQEQNQQSQQATQQQMLQSQQSQSSQHQDQKSGYVGSMMKQTTMQHLVRQDRKKTKNLITHQPYSPKYKEGRERELQKILQKDQKFHTEIKNKKALEVLERIKKKLVRKDFNEKEQLSVEEQVKKLINQATSHENICQAYIGWCPFW